MADAPPYLPSVKNVPAILEKIRIAGTPPRFTHEILEGESWVPELERSRLHHGAKEQRPRLGTPTSDGS